MRFTDEDGFTLVLSFVLIIILTILVIAVSSILINEGKSSQKYLKEKQAYYYARAGTEYAIGNFNLFKDLNDDNTYAMEIVSFDQTGLGHSDLMGVNSYEDLPNNSPTEVFVEKSGDQFSISSKGNYKGEEAKVSVVVEIDSASLPPLDYAVFAVGDGNDVLELNGSSTVNGDVGTNASSFAAINFTGAAGVNGDFWINKEEYTPPSQYNESPRHPEWSNVNIPYTKGDKVYYDGLHYEAKWWTDVPPGQGNAWNLIIPDDEIWEWFATHTYLKGEQVWHDGQIYTAKWNKITDSPPNNGWEKQVPNVSGNIEYLTGSVDFPPPEMPSFPSPPVRSDLSIQGNQSDEINQDGTYEQISLKSGTELVIDRNGGDRIIRVKDFDIKNGHIKFKDPEGDGVLKIYIEEKFTFKADSSINKPTSGQNAVPENVEIYYTGNSTPDFGGNISLNGSLFIENADFDLGGSSSTYGYIFSNGNKITIRGAANASTIYAPNTHVEMNGLGNYDAVLRGAVVASSFSGDGAVQIDYQQPDLDKMPENFVSAVSGNQGNSNSSLKIINWGRN